MRFLKLGAMFMAANLFDSFQLGDLLLANNGMDSPSPKRHRSVPDWIV